MRLVLLVAALLEADVTLTGAQIAALGVAIVTGSFALNAVLVGALYRGAMDRLGRVERTMTGDDGVLVRLARIETQLENPPAASRSLSPMDVGGFHL